ncbi:hypothetical protein EIL87_11515 [Saccharopolyspora rhizosphaerae]|uniref:DUF2383 domain-containing protein n=1 Tax=Saccharopolyspora rhizosphaerae TaxID=2492662 RepID=A0A426JV02_9PSEU|nr:hypothetical protein [Saccharopolyspora rhizosphaerae]RRO16911.1 hypothetical protein EIL87_11515 [Saccharopolyspora rhizosphaerae]
MRRRQASTPRRFLAIYLNDHLAGAMGGVGLAQRSAQSHRSEKLWALAEEIDEDRRTLLRIMRALDVQPARYKVLAARVAERLGQLKTNGRIVRRSPLSPLVELEALHLGVHGKASCWRTLLAMSDHIAELDPPLLRELLARAQAQVQVLEDLHHARARHLAKMR